LGAFLDAQIKRKALQWKRELLMTLLVVGGMTRGGFGWFVQSPTRVQAFRDAMSEIRSVGDINGLVAKYQVALDKIAARSSQIDEATVAMGGDPTLGGDEDPYFEAETEPLTGEKRASSGERHKKLQQQLGKVVKTPLPATDKAVAKTATGDGFEWDK
jgi:hypothetical protein